MGQIQVDWIMVVIRINILDENKGFFITIHGSAMGRKSMFFKKRKKENSIYGKRINIKNRIFIHLLLCINLSWYRNRDFWMVEICNIWLFFSSPIFHKILRFCFGFGAPSNDSSVSRWSVNVARILFLGWGFVLFFFCFLSIYKLFSYVTTIDHSSSLSLLLTALRNLIALLIFMENLGKLCSIITQPWLRRSFITNYFPQIA